MLRRRRVCRETVHRASIREPMVLGIRAADFNLVGAVYYVVMGVFFLLHPLLALVAGVAVFLFVHPFLRRAWLGDAYRVRFFVGFNYEALYAPAGSLYRPVIPYVSTPIRRLRS